MKKPEITQAAAALESTPDQTALSSSQAIDRRQFLRAGVTGLAALNLASLAFADNDGEDDDGRGQPPKALGKGIIDVGPVSSLKLGAVLDRSRDLGLVVTRTANGIIALSNACTHNGCPTAWSAAATVFACPCHGARFGSDGAVKIGPARQPLARYAINVKNGRILVDTNTLISRSSVKPCDFVKP